MRMLMVVTIIALPAMLVGCITLIDRKEVARAVAARIQIDNFEQALVQYKLRTGVFPTTDQGLEALRPYLTKEIRLDPWGHPYVYKFPGEHGGEPDIVSYGADDKPGGEGPNSDIGSWKN